MSVKNIVRVSGVTKDFDLGKLVVNVLKGIDLEIETGKYVSIMGPSGSGKSTLFNMIGGLDKPTDGKVFIDEVWPTEEALNRWTISPDNVADLSVLETNNQYKYDVPVLWTRGIEVTGSLDEKRSAMNQLLEYSYDAGINDNE